MSNIAEILEIENQIDEQLEYVPLSEEHIETYIQLAMMCKEQKHIDDMLRITNKTKKMCENKVRDSVGIPIFEFLDYCRINNISTTETSLYEQILLLESPYLFDSYLLYLEKNREEKDRFYLPKREQLNKHGLIQAMQDLEDDKLDILSISMPPGTQKAVCLYTKVLTPNGFVPMKDITVGSEVVAGSGNITKVLAESDIKVKPIYELTFDDGSTARCSDDHLWTVQTRDDRRRHGNGKYRTIPLSDMLKNFRVENGKRANYSIDYVPRIEFSEKEYKIPPYVLGVLIGDGCISCGNLTICNLDKEVLDRFCELMPDYELNYNGHNEYRIKSKEKHRYSQLRLDLENYGIYGCRSYEKFIPKEYLYGSHEQRFELLRGLMDTDGFADKRGNGAEYNTTSKQLADDVQELAHSLGFYASVKKRKGSYKKDGIKIECRDNYNITIQSWGDSKPIFHLSRKKDRYKPKRTNVKRYIEDIKYIADEPCKCIYVDDPTHLYIIDHYIMTHNTTLEKFFTSWIIGRHLEDYSLFFSHSADITRMFYDGVLDIVTSQEYAFSEIFPNAILQSTNAKAETINFNNYKPFANLQCTSVGAKNAGKVRCNRYLLCDDLIGGIEEALNKNQLDKLWRIYGTDARQRKLNEQVKEIHIATRWSVHDVIGRLKRIYEDDKRARFIAIPDIDPKTGKSNFDYKYNGMSVDFFKNQALCMDDISYRCLYKNEPIEREGLLYHEDDLRRYMELPEREPDAILGVCDTKSKGTDFLFLPCFYQYGTDYYLVDCICTDSADYGLLDERMANLIVNYNMQQCEFESNAGGDRVAYDVEQRIKKLGARCNITTKPTETNKETKIIVNADWIKKNVLFKDNSLYTSKDDYGIMMGWLLSYSVVGKNPHDDIPDGLANFALYVTKGSRVATVEAIKNPFRTNWY